ncbi:LysR substrate-binding domain-containing protein [Methanothrix soehngenii]|uniref:LysR substrate-binding domain-containing protein n=1 Tax=Methanothrix soehngenii TaxID=2223 RepID=UPI003AB991A4
MEDVFRDRAPGAPTGAQLGVATDTPRALAHRLLEMALADFPGAPLIVREGPTTALAEDLRQQRLDLVLSTSRLPPGTKDEFITKRVGRIPLVFAAVPRRAATVRRWPDDLGRQPMVLPAGGAYREIRTRGINGAFPPKF